MKQKPKKKYQSLKKYFKYFRKYPLLVAGMWLSLIGTAVFSLLGPWYLGQMIAAITTQNNHDLTIKYAVIFIIIEFAGLVVGQLRVPCFKKLENNVKRDVKLEILGSGFEINIGEFEKLAMEHLSPV